VGRLGRSSGTSVSYSEVLRRDEEIIRYLEKLQHRTGWQDATVRTLAQMMQAENAPVRLQLVKNLSAVKGEMASAALAQRAVFDLSAEVREAAVQALRERPGEEYRPVLLAALRYPWAPMADHAAEALVNLDNRKAVPYLVGLLDQPDPLAPVQGGEKKQWVAPQLVRVNHLQNCLLCHAPSFDRDDPVQGLGPERDRPLPEAYYGQKTGTFVRADVTYLKQDFSVVQPVADPGKWPRLQRFDYLVRKRELNAEEAARRTQDRPTSYPQREAVLWALRELTGEDVGDQSEDWQQFVQGESQ
jgi:HEAT repeat protein